MKILFFSPHAALWVHAFPEALVAEALMQKGHAVSYITCGGQLSGYCVAMSGMGLQHDSTDVEKKRVCALCATYKELLRSGFGLPGHDLEAALTAADRAAIEEVIAAARPESIASLVVDGIPVGKASLYQFAIRKKKVSLELTAGEWEHLKIELRNSLAVHHAGRTILDREKPERVVTYNSLYSVNRVIGDLARQRGIPAYNLQAGANLAQRLQTLAICRDDAYRFFQNLLSLWLSRRDMPCPARRLAAATDHMAELVKGTSVFAYAGPGTRTVRDVRGFFGVQRDQRLVVAVLSSYDELFAAEVSGIIPESRALFPTQVDWLKHLIAFFVRRPDLHLVIRVHPRELRNRRESVVAEHTLTLAEVLRELPPNVRVNWPADGLTMLELAEETDLFLNAWSSAGKEMALLGQPVIVYAPELLFYPPDLNAVATTSAEYDAAIDRELSAGWSLERLRRAYRWHAFEFHSSVVDISDGFAYKEPDTLAKRAWAKLKRTLVPRLDKSRDVRARPRRLAQAELISGIVEAGVSSPLELPDAGRGDRATLEEETAGLKIEVRRLVRTIYGDLARTARAGLKNRLLDFVDSPPGHARD